MPRKVKINPEAKLPQFLKDKIEKHGKNGIFVYEGPTHGCVMREIPITFPSEEKKVFYTVPREAVIDSEESKRYPKEAMSFF